jgi:hypothetical protein
VQTTGAAVLPRGRCNTDLNAYCHKVLIRKVKRDFASLPVIAIKEVELRWMGVGCRRPTDRGRGPDLFAKNLSLRSNQTPS